MQNILPTLLLLMVLVLITSMFLSPYWRRSQVLEKEIKNGEQNNLSFLKERYEVYWKHFISINIASQLLFFIENMMYRIEVQNLSGDLTAQINFAGNAEIGSLVAIIVTVLYFFMILYSYDSSKREYKKVLAT